MEKNVDGDYGQQTTLAGISSADVTSDKVAVSGASDTTTGKPIEEKSKTKDQADTLTNIKKKGLSTTKSDKIVLERLTVHENENSASAHQSNNYSTKAIVEVLDRVDTPQTSSIKVVGGIDNNGEPTAFSVLPNEGRYEDQKQCECFECCKNTFRTSSSKCRQVLYFNNYIRLYAPERIIFSNLIF